MKTELLKNVGFMQPFHFTEFESPCKKTSIVLDNKYIGYISITKTLSMADPDTVVFIPDKK